MLVFDRFKVKLPKDHIFYKLTEEFPERFGKMKAFNHWYLRGPSITDESYHFVLTCEELSIQKVFSLSESEMLFDTERVVKFFDEIAQEVLSVELSSKFVGRLHGKSAEEVHEEPEDIAKIYVSEQGGR